VRPCSATFLAEQLGKVREMICFTDQAIDAYQRSVELNADSPSVWESLDQIYKQKENFTQADFAFSQAIAYQTKRVQSRRDGDYGFTLCNLGNIYREAGNIDAAKETYLRDIRENPKMAIMSLHELAHIYLAEGNEKSALEMAYQIMLQNPKHKIPEAEAWEYLAAWYYQHNRDQDGFRCKVNAPTRTTRASSPSRKISESCRKPPPNESRKLILRSGGATMTKLRRIIVLVWAVALAAMAMLVVAAGLVTRKGAGR
jgi:tetratricopeptide (TPR) repeat protein